jgi:hypothetical protein
MGEAGPSPCFDVRPVLYIVVASIVVGHRYREKGGSREREERAEESRKRTGTTST